MSKPSRTSIVFFGTSHFAVPVLELLVKDDWPIKLVITQPDRPIGRHQKLQPPPVKIVAKKLHLKTIQPPSLKNLTNLTFNEFNGIFIVCAYGQMIPGEILKNPRYGAINIHPSLLPKYRGPSPIQTAILNGDKKTGVSIMLLDEEMDHGPLLAQKELRIKNQELRIELERRLAKLGAELLVETLPKYLAGEIKPQSQNHSQATFTKILTREDGRIDWSRPAQEIYNQWRALTPWPGIYTILSWRAKRSRPVQSRDCFGLQPRNDAQKNPPELRIKLIGVSLPESSLRGRRPRLGRGNEAIPFIKLNKKGLGVVCGDGQILPIALLQPEGKKMINAEEFINGYLIR